MKFNSSSYQVYLLISLSLLLFGCAQSSTEQIAKKSGFQAQYIQTSNFKLASHQKLLQTAAIVNIYVEGDGHVINGIQRISNDPSPHGSLTMQLAAQDPNPNVVYLARPCQYSPDDLQTICSSKYWTTARYSQSVIDALNQAVDQIKAAAGSRKVNLIGYSGGGALVVLIAAKRNDVASMRTVAGNLDLTAMQKHHNSQPLTESLDPIQVAKKTRNIPQLHFVGAKDQVVPVVVAENFRQAAGLKSDQVMVLPKVEHNRGWAERWPKLLEYVP